VKARTGLKVRGIEFSLLQRCGAHIASGTDLEEAEAVGRIAVEKAAAGASGYMVAIARGTGPDGGYAPEYVLIPLEETANRERKVPREWINAAGNQVTQAFIDYVCPLIQGEPERLYENSLPRYARLKKILARN